MAVRESVGTQLGQYQIRGRIGSGGMGDVFDAVHVGLHKRVAIKTLRKQLLEDETVVARFLREGQLASRIRHPNIVDVTDVGMIDGLPCLVMELLEGESLSAYMKREKSPSLASMIDLMLPVVAALEHAHAAGVLHRDLKPSNIFLARSWNGEVVSKVLDFGISKLLSEPGQQQLTTDSAFVGTPQYASPEATRAEKTLDARSDQYSLGVILYEASTGARPFAHRAGSFLTLAMAICAGDFAPPRAHRPELPEAFERAVLRAMATHPDGRFASLRELGAALLPFASERGRLLWEPTFGAAALSGVGAPTEELHTAVLASPAPFPSGPPSTTPLNVSGIVPSGAFGARAYGSSPPSLVNHGPMTPPSFGPGPLDAGQGTFASQSVATGGTPAPRQASFGLAVLGGVAVAAVVAGTFLVSRTLAGSRNDEDVAVAAYVVSVTVDPAAATLEVDGVPVARGRLEQRFADDKRHVLRASAPGFEPTSVEFDRTSPPPPRLALRTQAAGSPTAATPTAAATGRPHPTGPGPASHGASTRPAKDPGAKDPPKNGDPRPHTDNINPWD